LGILKLKVNLAGTGSLILLQFQCMTCNEREKQCQLQCPKPQAKVADLLGSSGIFRPRERRRPALAVAASLEYNIDICTLLTYLLTYLSTHILTYLLEREATLATKISR
jgi:hypothetical protein